MSGFDDYRDLCEERDQLRAELEASRRELFAYQADVEGANRRELSFATACVRNVEGITVGGALEMQRDEIASLRAELAELRARVPAICFPRQPKCDIAEVIVDQVENWLSGSVPSDDFIIDVTEEQKDALNSIVWEWFYKNVSPNHWTVTDVHQHEAAILAAKENKP